MHVIATTPGLLGILAVFGSELAPATDRHVPSQYPTVRAAIDACVAGDTVIIADGTYSGTGNKDLDFAGKAIAVRSASGDPTTCILDCEGSGRGFYFHSGEAAASIVQGLTIRNGNAAGVYCAFSSPTLTHCTITGTTAEYDGGGVYCYGSSPTFTNCTITDNTAGYAGGGVYCEYYSNPTLADCTVTGNSANHEGGGMSCSDESSPTLTNCTITGNMACGGLGGGVYCWGCGVVLTSCTITGNTARNGGGVCCYEASPTLTNCTITENTASNGYGGGVCCYYASPALITCAIAGNTAGNGGGVYSSYSSPILSDCTITGNATGDSGGGVYCDHSGPALVDCTISENTACANGGGICCYSQCNAILANCIISGNTVTGAHAFGGGVSCLYSSPTITNCMIADNAAEYGGGVSFHGFSSSRLTNCTVVGNTASTDGGGMYCSFQSSPILANSVFWADSCDEIFVSSSSPVVTYCNVQGGYDGTGNIDVNPLFVRNPNPGPDGQWGTPDDDRGDLHLTHGSPCIDAGDNTAVPVDVTVDLDGNPRFGDVLCRPDTGNGPPPVVDMGAREVPNDALIDCNANGIDDLCDVLSGTSLDENGNTVPDECEGPGDLNCDGAVDFFDINAFVLYLLNFPVWQTTYAGCHAVNGDINGDGVYPSFTDINPFVTLLSAHSPPLACSNR